eukprot:Gregarina_sp_Pseudo_9__845@NODE_1541_length_1509_cov_256_710204_g1428_i0_p1_GENE_NODE_1541_length_1509_cov_256_710204_g1428_i0NODE_1541_length_1509_cov_256_710204_g1428_i0_p1_ORF_typecomplete_len252_score22_48SecG/PF03840_14/0_16_NODE_1541_length_1509_cov_256_710204_g1428_i06511406
MQQSNDTQTSLLNDRRYLGLEPTETYFDVYSFIADQHSIQVDLKTDAPCAGLFDPESSSHGIVDLPMGSRVTLPLAAASLLVNSELAEAQMPAALSRDGLVGSVVKNFTRESCCLVDLKSVSPVFFEYASSVAHLMKNSDLELDTTRILTERLCASARLVAHESEVSGGHHKVNRSNLHPSVALFEAQMKSCSLPQRVLLQHSEAGSLAGAAAQGGETSGGLDTQQTTTFLQGLTLSEAQVLQVRRRNLEL